MARVESENESRVISCQPNLESIRLATRGGLESRHRDSSQQVWHFVAGGGGGGGSYVGVHLPSHVPHSLVTW